MLAVMFSDTSKQKYETASMPETRVTRLQRVYISRICTSERAKPTVALDQLYTDTSFGKPNAWVWILNCTLDAVQYLST